MRPLSFVLLAAATLFAIDLQAMEPKIEPMPREYCYLAKPDVFETMTGWVHKIHGDELCVFALPNKGQVKVPMVKVNGKLISLRVAGATGAVSSKIRTSQSLARFESYDGNLKVEILSQVHNEVCRGQEDTECFPPRSGELSIQSVTGSANILVEQYQ